MHTEKKITDKDIIETTDEIPKIENQEQPKSIIIEKTVEETKLFYDIYARAKGIEAKGEYYSSNKIIVKAGSSIVQNVTSGFKGKDGRNKLIKKHIDKNSGEWIVKEDIEFSSPSGAIKFVMGSSLNGWNYWHLSENNKPLQSIKESNE